MKKQGLDPELLTNYRPNSTPPFLTNVVALQIQQHITSHELFKSLQTGFQAMHSTETALVKVVNNLCAADAGNIAILIILICSI